MKREVKIGGMWDEFLQDEVQQPYFEDLMNFVEQQYDSQTVYPQLGDMFRAFEACPLDRLKVVILGQDPYHGQGQANGLCFSVPVGVKLPPSLNNIFKEVAACGYTTHHPSGDLQSWAQQGVLLLNSVLTVQAHTPESHRGKGWERFTDAVITQLNQQKSGIVFMLWGTYAKRKARLLDPVKHLILTAVHPSPLSAYRGFLGCGHFALANQYLGKPIDW